MALCTALTNRTHGCTDQAYMYFFANPEPSTHGTFCHANRASQ
jgi:hypothetical protein